MSGHNKWAQIKHKKGAADIKRSKLFSKLSIAISIAARDGADPSANMKLRAAIDKAKASQMPQDNIDRAIRRVAESKEKMEDVTFEAYGPEGVAIIIEAFTDSRNRTVSEIKKTLSDHASKLGEPGSVRWAFDQAGDEYTAKYSQSISEGSKNALAALIEELEERDDVRGVWTNAQ